MSDHVEGATEASAPLERWVWIPSVQAAPEFFAESDSARWIDWIRERDARALLWTYEDEGAALVEAIHAATGAPVCPVVPNMAAYARDTRDKGFVGAALDRLLRLPPGAIARIAFGNLTSVREVLAKDFSTGVCILAEMELARFKRFNPPAAFLNNQMVDLAVGFDNAALFERFARLASKRYGMEAGFITYNFGHLAPSLRKWGVAADRIITPLNPKGYLMYPDRETCEARAPEFTEALVATEADAGGTAPENEAHQYLYGLGVSRLIVSPI